MQSFREEGEEDFIPMSFMCIITQISPFGVKIILDFASYLARAENACFVIFDSHIAYKWRCFVLSDNPMTL